MVSDHELTQLLQQTFSFNQFRPGQREVIRALLEQHRVVCIQPTGYGKSLLYQLPALLFEGITLVISPLLALMRDQLDHLRMRFKIPAGTINTDQEDSENDAVRHAAVEGRLKILFIAPEQLDNLDTRAFIQSLRISLMVVDEAHCISTWGHDFRPSYRSIVRAARLLAERNASLRLLGLTATADARVEADIAAQFTDLKGNAAIVLRSSMDRPNLALGLVPVGSLDEKLAWLEAALPQMQGCGIIYCATREHTEIVATYLQQRGLEIDAYHAGFEPVFKRRLQQGFIAGRPRLIAATNALGMGIDKPDIRTIIHFDLPSSITAYYQEVGRAGRDGLNSRGILLFNPADRKIQDHFIHSAQPTRTDFEKVRAELVPDELQEWPSLMKVRIRTGLHPTRVTVILAELEEQGFSEKVKQGRKQVYRRGQAVGEPNLERYERQYEIRSRELGLMMAYGAGERGCLMQTLRKALGDLEAPKCGRCSICVDWAVVQGTDRATVRRWLAGRDVVIRASKLPLMESGLALFNADLKDPEFVLFMRQRASTAITDLPASLLQRLQECVRLLKTRHAFAAVVAVPSHTWAQRNWVQERVAQTVAVPVWDCLAWSPQPERRQGSLFNNDQRKDNVAGKLTLTKTGLPNSGAILLLDDYTGSNATLKEAVRCIRKHGGFKNAIVPLTIAQVRWRLGHQGFL